MGFNKKVFLFSLLLIVAFLFMGCRKERSNEGIKQKETTPSPGVQVLEEESSIGAVNLFLENSHSMAPYFQELTDFNKKVDNIIVELTLNKSFNGKVFCNTIATSIDPYNSIDKFRSDLDPTNKTKIAIGDSSPLDSIIGKVCENSNPDDVNILITDGIVSGSNDKLKGYDKPKEGVYYNKVFAGNLKNNIRIQLNQYIDSFGIKIFAYHSEFNATKKNPYYTLSNSKKTGFFTSRPYYIILIAKPQLIKKFEDEVPREFSDAIESLEVGFYYPDLSVKLTGYLENQKNCRVSNNELTFIDGMQSYSFGILANLSELNEGQTRNEYIQDNSYLFVNNKVIEGVEMIVYDLDDIPSGVFINKREVKKEIQNYTHLIIINIDKYQVDIDDKISFRIKNMKDNWYEDWNSFDDLDIELDDERTFNFVYFIEGIIESYGEISEDYLVDQEIKFKIN